jgi:hypothetical protein
MFNDVALPKGETMKRTILALVFLLVTSSAAIAQFAPSTENLRGLSGVRLMVMLGHYPHRLDEAQRPELLKMVEADATAKLEKAGIPLVRFNSGMEIKAGSGILVVTVPMDEANSSMSLTTEVKLLQKVRLARDLSIETDAVTWSREGGVGGQRPLDSMIREQFAAEIDQFIKDYFSVNPKQSARSNDKVSKSRKR